MRAGLSVCSMTEIMTVHNGILERSFSLVE